MEKTEHDRDVRIEREGHAIRQILHLSKPFTHPSLGSAANPNYTASLRFLAASLAAAGLAGEAADVGRALLVLEPASQVEAFCSTYAYKESSRRDALAHHLRLAGLPG